MPLPTSFVEKNDKGQTRSFLVTRMDDETLTVDGNNPLCGRQVVFTLEKEGIPRWNKFLLPLGAFALLAILLASVFMYMVGNTDWSLPYLHNIRVFQNFTSYIAVPYDFDWSGIVDAPYAVPDYRLNIKSVRDRIWRGTSVS